VSETALIMTAPPPSLRSLDQTNQGDRPRDTLRTPRQRLSHPRLLFLRSSEDQRMEESSHYKKKS
jgi:hypothetical protein